jgi:hypothetical protein
MLHGSERHRNTGWSIGWGWLFGRDEKRTGDHEGDNDDD